ncbi:MAG: hypothetical protein ACREV6_05015 [Clostridium sp.]|uniref:hypothetical protein n=1 Tax=Clostridium sp. TaxID=1506 RepID=UPI003D6D9832
MALSNDAFDKLNKELEIESNFNKAFMNSFKYDNVKGKQIIISLVMFFTFTIISYPIAKSENTSQFVLGIIDLAINFSVGIIGFSITGFALYAALLENKSKYILILTQAKGKKINMYKSNLLIFFKSFGIFIMMLTYGIFMKYGIMLYNTSLINKFLYNFAYQDVLTSIVISVTINIVLMGVYTLKIFIFNIYSSMLSMGKDELNYKRIDVDKYIEFLENKKKSDKV